ncbi:DegT/DnrJ/EryC1/StrS family aminotransferase [Bacillus cereus]|uniref:DegT/DnrJ/EryC1/StrS family aminotransferase n=1 Tax=Bacillus cereus TaxID=1396 RepID=UPI001596E00A|nr:DegT/DnrJ/EryC1/StrS aminotransferase family protein [Bacillus cereus]
MSITSFIPFSKPSIDEKEVNEVIDTLRSGWLTTGKKVEQLEDSFAKYINVPYAIAVNSCTAGLELALSTLELEPGDEVICSTLTFAATVNVIEKNNLVPKLVDVDADTLNMDINQVRKAINKRTKAIMVVHFAGHSCDMDELMELKKEHNLTIIEDAAHALPAKYKSKTVGTIGDICVFSFYANKTMTTGEGGMIVCKERNLAEQIKIRRLHGLSKSAIDRYTNQGSWDYDILYPGFKSNMSDLNAAIGIHQLDKLSSFHRRRVEVAAYYNKVFKEYDCFIPPSCKDYVSHAWWIYPLRLNLIGDQGEIRNKLIEGLREHNIGTSVHFKPIHMHKYYKDKYGYKSSEFPIATREFYRILSLPNFPLISDVEIKYVAQNVIDLTKELMNDYNDDEI